MRSRNGRKKGMFLSQVAGTPRILMFPLTPWACQQTSPKSHREISFQICHQILSSYSLLGVHPHIHRSSSNWADVQHSKESRPRQSGCHLQKWGDAETASVCLTNLKLFLMLNTAQWYTEKTNILIQSSNNKKKNLWLVLEIADETITCFNNYLIHELRFRIWRWSSQTSGLVRTLQSWQLFLQELSLFPKRTLHVET